MTPMEAIALLNAVMQTVAAVVPVAQKAMEVADSDDQIKISAALREIADLADETHHRVHAKLQAASKT